MKAHFEIEQGSIEWFQIKQGKIGGTRSKGLFIKSDNLLLDLLSEITEDFDEDAVMDSYLSDAMERGNELEPQARIELEKYTGFEFLPVGWLQSVESPLLGISPDGITQTLSIGCEIKCPGAKKHLTTCLEDVIPLDHINQCIHNFAVNPILDRFYFMSYRPESIKPIFVKVLTRDSLVNIGTKSRPVLKTITEVVELEHKAAKQLELQIEESINTLKF